MVDFPLYFPYNKKKSNKASRLFALKFVKFNRKGLGTLTGVQLSHLEVLYDINSEEVRGPQAVPNMFSDYFIHVRQSTVSVEINFSPRRIHKLYFPPPL